jgi:DNA-binding NarL/FixJ family response regulator
MREPINLLLVDDHELFLDGLCSLLSAVENIHILSTALNGREALEQLEQHQPDVLLTDLSMPEVSGIELISKVKSKYPAIRILVLSMHDDRETIAEIMMAEAEGYVLKNTGKKELMNAIDRLMEGGTFYSNRVMEIMLDRYKAVTKKQEAEALLTDREVEVLGLIAAERSSKEIAEELFISVRTVDTHRKNLLRKVGASSVIGLLKYGVSHGLVRLE